MVLTRRTARVSICVVGRLDDPHACAVVEAVQRRNGRLVLVDAEELSKADLLLSSDRVVLPDLTGALVELSGGRGWLRRLAPEHWHADLVAGEHEAVVRSAWVTALLAACASAGLEWLSPVETLYSTEDKLMQQRACQATGIDYPPTVVVTRPERIPAELGDELVVKPLGMGYYRDATGIGRVVHATKMSRGDDHLALLAGAPFLVQKYVPSRTHLRVVTVRDSHWVSELDAEGLPVDWRADEAAHTSFRPGSHATVGERAVAVAAHLGVGYSSQDWIIDRGGTPIFLDLNPAGQWLFLPSQIADRVTEAIADWLVCGTRSS